MTYAYKQDHISKTTPNNRRPAIKLIPTTITIHNTANESSTAQNERNWLTNISNKSTASYHIVIDEKEAIECIPLDEVAWHAGDGSGVSSGNKTSIGVEICESGNYANTLDNAVNHTAKMLKERGWGIDRLRRHHDWSGKNCPRKMNADGEWSGWIEFKKRVEEKLKSDTAPTKTLPQITKERIYSENGILKKYPLNTNSGKATDVRHIKFETGKVRYRFVYEKGAKVSELVKKYNADFGFNAPFFYNGLPLGDSEDNDKVISSAYGKMLKWHEFAVVDGKPIIGQLDKSDEQELLVQGSPLLVSNGKASYAYYSKVEETNLDITDSRCQRTFIWTDSKGDLHLAIGDGRTAWDKGLNLQEMALYALSYDAQMCLNFDGGGSTILATKDGGINQKENTGVNERIVHHALLVFIKTDEEIEKEKQGEAELEEFKVNSYKIDLIDGEKIDTVDGFVKDGVSYVPVRVAGNFFGVEVGYDAVNNRAQLIK